MLVIITALVLVTLGLAVRAGPAALGCLLQLGLQADQVVGAGAGVA